MGLFNRKRKREAMREEKQRHDELMEELSKPPCQRKGGKHLWQDFPPVIKWSTSTSNPYIEIQETYVCKLCGKRDDRQLEKFWWNRMPKEETFYKKLREMRDQYKGFVQPLAIVEDMIEDAQHVDRQRLKIWEQIHAPEKPVPETEEERLERYKIELLPPRVLEQ